MLGHGFNSVVIETAGGAVVRIGRDPQSYRGYELESRLLPAVAPVLPTAVPAPRWLIEPSDDVPGGAIGYAKLPGGTLTLELFAGIDRAAFADAIASFLAALHRIDTAPLDYVPAAGPHERRRSDLELRDAVMPALREHLPGHDFERVRGWWDSYIADPLMMDFDCVLTHGDLWYGNMLVDHAGRLAGILDWEIARVGDPARDFAGLKYFGVPFIDDVLQRYGAQGGAVTEALRARIDRIIVMREFYGVLWSIRGRDGREFSESIEKLRRTAIFDPAAALLTTA